MANEAMVEEALRTLGADQAELAAGGDRTGSGFLRSVFLPAGHFENAVALLGQPLTSETIGPAPSESLQTPLIKLTWQLPLWPDLVFCLEGMPGLPIPHKIGFARPPRTPPAVPSSWEDLHPWAWIRGEVIGRFGPPIDQGADNWHHEDFKFQIHDADGNSRQFRATFSWDLLQHIEWP
jgi:hypothetical protein